jgi:hypothetical protein
LHVKTLAFSHRFTFVRPFLPSHNVDERVHVTDRELTPAEVEISCLKQSSVIYIDLESFIRGRESIEALKKASFWRKKILLPIK